jgi:hypothetical protein
MRLESDETGGQPDDRPYPAVEGDCHDIRWFSLAGVAVPAGGFR